MFSGHNHHEKIKPLFKNDKTIFIKPLFKNSPPPLYNTLATVPYQQEIEHQLKKIVQRISENQHRINFQNLISPTVIYTDTIEKKKLLVMPLKVDPISTFILAEQFNHKFTQIQIVEAAYGGFRALKQLHSLNIIHGCINPETTYFFNRQLEIKSFSLKKSLHNKKTTQFGLIISDIQNDIIKAPKTNTLESIFREMFFSRNKMLNFQASYKDDLQSMLYVLVYMLKGSRIFDPERFDMEWKTAEKFVEWKIEKLFLEILGIIPYGLQVLIQAYLQFQDLGPDSKFEFDHFLKKLIKAKESLIEKQPFAEVGDNMGLLEYIDDNLEDEILKENNNSGLNLLIKEQDIPQLGVTDDIQQEAINITVRPNLDGAGKHVFKIK